MEEVNAKTLQKRFRMTFQKRSLIMIYKISLIRTIEAFCVDY